MKKDPLHDHRACFIGTCLALGAIVALISHSTALAADDEKRDSGGFVEKMKKWQDEMSQKFHEAFKKLEADSKEKPLTTASADLREEKDNYIVRLNLPGRNLENVEVKLTGDSLHIVAPAEKKATALPCWYLLAFSSPRFPNGPSKFLRPRALTNWVA
jgi:hypothetical protein